VHSQRFKRFKGETVAKTQLSAAMASRDLEALKRAITECELIPGIDLTEAKALVQELQVRARQMRKGKNERVCVCAREITGVVMRCR
jgi:hypothetical protein